MPLIPFEPFRQLDAFRDEMNRWMNHNFPSWAQQTFSFGPRVDVSQSDKEVIVEAEIPGLTEKDNLDIEVHPTQVILSGEINRSRSNREPEERDRQRTENERLPSETSYYHTERYVGKFQRVIALPAEVDEEKASAEYENGVLEIRIPKMQADKGKKLDVRFH